MDIDDDPSTSHDHHGSNAQENGVSGSSSDTEPEWSPEDWMADMRRVKVYELVGTQWTDRGTALCSGVYDEELDQAAIVAKSEIGDLEILRSQVRGSDVYQRQQETLIVWTEPDGTDYALSFQDMEGCAEIWDFILEVQRHFRGKNGDDSSLSPLASGSGSSHSRLTVASIVASGRLPEPALGIIGDLEAAIKVIAKTLHGRERICEYILNEDYIKSLIDVMEQAEDLESLTDLHALYSIMHTILSMNDHGIFDYILHEDVFLGVVGILEYDPEFPTYKASYRDFIKNSSQFMQVIEIKDDTVQRKIHQTYRLQYLKDVVLARVLDDSTFNVLNSFIIFNQIDIINHITQDATFLADLLRPFTPSEGSGFGAGPIPLTNPPAPKPPPPSNPNMFNTISLSNGRQREQAPSPPPSSSTNPSSTSPSLPTTHANSNTSRANSKADAIRFVHQLCLMGKNVQIPTRLALYRTLVERGVLYAIEWALRAPCHGTGGDALMLNGPQTGASMSSSDTSPLLDIAAEVLIVVVDHHVAGVRSHIVRQNDLLKARGPENELRRAAIGLLPPRLPIAKEKEQDKDEPVNLLKALMDRLGGTKDVPFRNQIGDSLRMLLEQPNIEFHGAAAGEKNGSIVKPREDPINEHFFPIFYESACISIFFKSLLDVPEWKSLPSTVLKVSREQASLFLYLCDLLCTFLVQHSHRSQYFVLSANISPRIASLLRMREKHMRLAALRYFRVCIRLNNQFIIRHLIKHDVFDAILELTEREAARDNLITGSCQEFFEHIRKDTVRLAMTHIMEVHGTRVRALAEREVVGPRFKAFINRWEQITAPPPKSDANASTETKDISALRRWGQGTSMEAEEESYFNTDEEEEVVSASSSSPPPSTPISPVAWTRAQHAAQNLKRKRGNAGSARGGMPSAAGARDNPVTRPRLLASTPRNAKHGSVSHELKITANTHPALSTSKTGVSTSPIVMPQPYPVRLSLVDYDDNDDDLGGLGPSQPEEDSTSITPPASPPSIASQEVSLKFTPTRGGPAGQRAASPDRRLTRTESMHAESRLLSGGASSSSSSPGRTVSPTPKRPRAGSFSVFDSNERILPTPSVAASPPVERTPSVPPLKRRRGDDDDDDEMMLSLLSGAKGNNGVKRRSTAEAVSSPSSVATKGKGKEPVEMDEKIRTDPLPLETDTTSTPDKPTGGKKIKLSLKSGLALGGGGKSSGNGSNPSPSPSLTSPVPQPQLSSTTVKDGDGG
ncbi:hypothetical protein BS47DRAFT_980933 [Hydnum rufescens UP504]|uniref:Serine/threonine-protein phosphatase 4 regulatory subunit 3-like central domain-containing protein n=1 Tax=Hydnum rufescens UP504 TaxID=1448309 RepID=A0A9P6DW13_9AGAM|nr:hypothetical protein BS47DRAFT_980933 [Hydnum rufescens UP504]